MVGGMEDQKLGMGFFLPLKFQKLTGQDFCAVSVSSHAVGFQIRRLDKEIVQGSRSLHQGAAHKGAAGHGGGHRQLSGGRLRIKLASRVDHHSRQSAG